MQKLLISIRGVNEALQAGKGGAHIADVEFPASALGTPYPLNILAVRNGLNKNGFKKMLVSTNIGEQQNIRANACQAAVGVAVAGADIIKCGLAESSLADAIYLARLIVRSVRQFTKKKKIIPAVFADKRMQKYFHPFRDGIKLLKKIAADGLLIDTYDKKIGKGLLDYCSIKDISNFVKQCHKIRKEAWIAGSITVEQLPGLWKTGVDVICVRGAACEQMGKGRFGEIKSSIVKRLVNTIP